MRYVALIILFCVPSYASAQVVLNEIMYDLEGSDSGREWVEIYNTGNDAVDLSEWRFFEGDTNHKLSVSLGNAVLPPGGYAIIADNAATFLEEHVGFSGTVFDSSFSLKNDGEFLALRDGELNDVEAVTYASAWGAAGDGSSLQRTGEVWVAAPPTPGGANASTPAPAPAEDGGETFDPAESEEEETTQALEPEFVTVDAGRDRTVSVGAAEFFDANAYKKDGSLHPYVEYLWNFGNGAVREGKKVLHQYNFPGTYVVWVSGTTADKLSATDRITVKAEPAELSISSVTPDHIALRNDSGRELDLSLWSLRANGRHYLFPENTILLSSASVAFPNAVTGLQTLGASDTALLYPNGMVAYAWGMLSEDGISSDASHPAVSAANPNSFDVSSGGEEAGLPKEDSGGVFGNLDTASQLAETGATDASRGGALYPWLLALFGVLLLAVFLILAVEKKASGESGEKEGGESKLTPDDFELVED